MQFIKNRVLRVVIRLFVSVLVLLLLFIASLQIPYIQTLLVNKTSAYLSEQLGYPIHIQKVNISLLGEGVLEGIDIYDKKQNEFIHADKALIDFRFRSFFNKEIIIVEHLSLTRPKVCLDWDKETELLNISAFIRDIRDAFKKKKEKKASFRPLKLLSASVSHGFFSYHDNRKVPINHSGFDHNYFELDSIYGIVNDFYIHYDTIQMQATNVKAVEKNKNYHVHNLNTFFRYTQKSLAFYDIDAKIENSYLSHEIVLSYDTTADLSEFNKKVTIAAQLNKSVIYTKDLAFFAPAVKSFRDKWTVTGNFSGKVNDFKATDFKFLFGKNSHLSGKVALRGLPNVAETYINIDLKNSQIDSRDLQNYLTKKSHFQVASKFGVIKFSSGFVGFPKDFVAYGSFNTALGKLTSDLRFEIREKEAFSYYRGHLKTENFNLKSFLNAKKLGIVNMDGFIEGNGFTIDHAKLNVKGNFSRLDFSGYPYKNISTNAFIQDGFVEGKIDIDDPYFKMESEYINIDLRDDKDIVEIDATIEKCFPKELNLLPDSSFFRGKIKSKTAGLDLDNLIGRLKIDEVYIYNNGKELHADQFTLFSNTKDSIRNLVVNSDFGKFVAKGDFKFKDLAKDIKNLLEEANLIFINNQEKTNRYYAQKDNQIRDYKISYNLQINDLNPILALFEPNAYISPNTNISGDFKHGKNTILNLYGIIDSASYHNHTLKDNLIDLSFSKTTDSTEVLASGTFKAAKYYNKNKLAAKNILFESLWVKDSLYFHTAVHHPTNSDYADLNGEINFKGKEILVSLFDSKITLLNKNWNINKGNQVRVGTEIDFKNLEFQNQSERVSLTGTLSQDAEKKLILKTENFNLQTLAPISPISFKGLANGSITLQNVYNDPVFSGKLNLSGLHLKEFALGDLDGDFSWKKSTNVAYANTTLAHGQHKLANLSGNLNLNNKQLNFLGKFNDAPLAFLEELLHGHATHMSGQGSGNVTLTGTIDEPKFNGSVFIKNGGFTIEYLKTHYTFQDYIHFQNDKIVAENIKLTDTLYNTTGHLDGYLQHNLFKDFRTDILLKLNNTLALNTKSEDNKLYYGTAFGTGDIRIFGPFSNLKIHSKELATALDTKLYIPLEETEVVGQTDYIIFKQPSQGIKASASKQLSSSNIDINLNFDIRENAYFEIIFDKKAGDIIRGYGEGQIELKLNTKGDFNVYGTYQITNGTYNFTLVNLINKRFHIDQGSVIRWNGDPYQGSLDVFAKYQLNTSLIPLIEDTAFIASTPDARRRGPVDVKMHLKGPLLNPEIKFGIDIINYPKYVQIEQAVNELESQIKYNEQLLNNQVFSLMVLKQFAPMQQQNGLNLATASGNNLSELFSNQFSYWISQFDENLEVDIDLEGFDENSNSSFRLKLSYSILDGKIRVTRDGRFTNLDNQSQLANLFGEWTIEYLISKNGNIRLKAYNRVNQNNISTAIQNTSSQLYGTSLSHTATFDNLRDLFRKNPNKGEMPEEDYNEPTPLKSEEEINEALPKNQKN